MSDFIKKALGMFVEFDETPDKNKGEKNIPSSPSSSPGAPHPIPAQQSAPKSDIYTSPMTQQDIDKFTRHFADVFDKANLDGLDYCEFSKMMEKLEGRIPDESTRIVTVFATLNMQGLTKDRILETARHYITVLDTDKEQFEKAAGEKATQEVENRKSKIAGLEKKVADNSEMIRKLTQEIAEAQATIAACKNEIVQYDSKISSSKGSYTIAYRAMYNKIVTDIQKLTQLI
ncbi:MAG: hypothetical protein H7257_13405 [Taibaiella sp.]|nr:hypothetical protein [Taibaiella sp.]